MRNRNRRWILFWFLIPILQLVVSEEINGASNSTPNIKDDPNLPSIFSPRMDYDQWKPLGRGDPLKNDPTYDYVPPVLDRVHYWVEPALRKPDPPTPGENQKTEILLLGITSKKPAVSSPQADSRRDTYDPYVKYVGPNYNSNQRIARPSFIPSVATSFFPSLFSNNKNKYSDRAAFSKGTEQRLPYTMLMPPPMNSKNSLNPLPEPHVPVFTQKPTTVVVYTTSPPPTTSSSTSLPSPISSVTVQAANLVYSSSSLSDASEWNNKYEPVASSVSWRPPSATTKRVIPDYREELIYNTNLSPPEIFIPVQFSLRNNTSKPLVAADSNQNINYVTPPPLINSQTKEIMFKGKVSDDNIDISNTYVKIGKPEAEMHTTGIGISNIPIESSIRHPMPVVPSNMVIFPHMVNQIMHSGHKLRPLPITMQEIQDMQTMHPPPVTQSPVYTQSTNAISNILQKESKPVILKDVANESQNYIASGSSVTNAVVTRPTILTTEETTTKITSSPTTEPTTTTSTTTSTTTTTAASLTTDPLFKHYKQPTEVLKGPLYLIIQGHSKVKTYGPSKQMNGILIQETNEISDEKDDFQVKHLHGFHKGTRVEEPSRKARTGNLQTLKHVIQTGLGSIDFSGVDEMKRRSDDDVKEAELKVGYEVAAEDGATTETYHKGIVEEARKLKL